MLYTAYANMKVFTRFLYQVVIRITCNVGLKTGFWFKLLVYCRFHSIQAISRLAKLNMVPMFDQVNTNRFCSILVVLILARCPFPVALQSEVQCQMKLYVYTYFEQR